MRPTAFVTGGGRGIGRAVVEALTADAWVAAADVVFPTPAGPADLEVVAGGGGAAGGVAALTGDAWGAAADVVSPPPAGPADLEVVADVREPASVSAGIERVAK